MEYLVVKDDKFQSNGIDIRLRGVGLGNWLNLEHFMFGLPGTDAQIRNMIKNAYGEQNAKEFWETYYNNYISEKDIEYVASLGLNHIRIPVNYKLFLTDDFDRSIAIKQIDRILNYCKKYDIWAIIDMHAVPGGQNPDWHSDNDTGMDNFWSNQDAMNQIIDLWANIAAYYKHEKAIGGFDIINEPCYFNLEYDKSMIAFFEKCTKAIRKYDQNHILFYSGNVYSRDFSMFHDNLDENCSYTFHLYPFLQIGRLLMENNDLDYCLKYSLENDVTLDYLRQQLKKPLWCGETGHQLFNADTISYLTKFIDLLNQNDIGWALWPLKDWGQLGLLTTEKESDWNKLCLQLSENWCFWDSFNEDSAITVKHETDKYAFYKRLAQNSTEANQTVLRNLSNVPFDVMKNALNSFLFDNCLRHSVLLLKGQL